MTTILLRAAAVAVLLGLATPALALSTNANVTITTSAQVGGIGAAGGASTSVQAQGRSLSNAKARADQEIDRRIGNLNNLISRISAMQKVDATFKANLSAQVQTQIRDLTNLKASIDADQETSTLKVEVQSIGKSYRIYALVMPQATLGAAAERSETLVGMFTTLGTKLEARLASSTDTAAVAALADFNAKVADAQVQATAVISHIANLQPDNGNKTVMQSNTDALKRARADIRVATQDFVAARHDAQTIMMSLGASASAAATASTTAQ